MIYNKQIRVTQNTSSKNVIRGLDLDLKKNNNNQKTKICKKKYY